MQEDIKKYLECTLACVGIVVGIALYLLPQKTITVTLFCLVSIFVLLTYPVWYCPWIKKEMITRVIAYIVLAVAVTVFGFLVWPISTPQQTQESLIKKHSPSATPIPDKVPSIEVLDVYPLCIGEHATKDPYTSEYGVATIIRVRGTHGTTFINELDLIGKKFLSSENGDDGCYMEYYHKNKASRQEIDKHFQTKKPYVFISLKGWPKESSSELKLEANQERYIKFIFLEPKSFYYARNLPHEPCAYVGFNDGTKKPITFEYPDFFYLFKMNLNIVKDSEGHGVHLWRPYDIRDEIKNGEINFTIKFGSDQLRIAPSKIRAYRRIRKEDWTNKTGQELILEKTYL